MYKTIDYKIIHTEVHALGALVRKALHDGWEVHGGPFVCGSAVVQAMVKREADQATMTIQAEVVKEVMGTKADAYTSVSQSPSHALTHS